MRDRNATWKELVLVFIGIVLLLAVAGCAAAAPAAKLAFPEDTALVCHEGRWFLYSKSAEQAAPMPFRCSET